MKALNRLIRLSKSAEVEPETEDEIQIEALPRPWLPGEPVFYGQHSRTVALLGEINQESSVGLISQLLELDMQDVDAPIVLHINSGGGSATDGLVLYDMIRALESPVIGLVMGSCMSAALAVLSACDYRIATPHSLFFYHQAITEVTAHSGEEIVSAAGYYEEIQRTYDKTIRERSKIPKRSWDKEFAGKTSKFLTAVQAKELGLIDAVLDYTDKKLEIEEVNDGNKRKGRKS